DGEGHIRFYGALSGLPQEAGGPIGNTYIPEDFAALKSFVEEVSSTARRTPSSVLVEESGDVSLTFLQGGVLRFVRSADRHALLENIASVFSARPIGADEALEYADFRFGDKVYVKFLEH
ncbi:MAG: hypothetical protein AAB923_00190, partial [Patescibacteria group bacterium]